MEYERIIEAIEAIESMYMGGNTAPRIQTAKIREYAETWKMRDELAMLEQEVGVYL